jgi:hypothetical protein
MKSNYRISPLYCTARLPVRLLRRPGQALHLLARHHFHISETYPLSEGLPTSLKLGFISYNLARSNHIQGAYLAKALQYWLRMVES